MNNRTYLTMGTMTRLEQLAIGLAFILVIYGCYVTAVQL